MKAFRAFCAMPDAYANRSVFGISLGGQAAAQGAIDGRGIILVLAIIDSSCAGLTRASILKNLSIFKTMDCRVKPGNDDEGRLDA
jgi:hypothetical protein